MAPNEVPDSAWGAEGAPTVAPNKKMTRDSCMLAAELTVVCRCGEHRNADKLEILEKQVEVKCQQSLKFIKQEVS